MTNPEPRIRQLAGEFAERAHVNRQHTEFVQSVSSPKLRNRALGDSPQLVSQAKIAVFRISGVCLNQCLQLAIVANRGRDCGNASPLLANAGPGYCPSQRTIRAGQKHHRLTEEEANFSMVNSISRRCWIDGVESTVLNRSLEPQLRHTVCARTYVINCFASAAAT